MRRSLRIGWDYTILGTRRAKEKITRAHDSVHVSRRRGGRDARGMVRLTVIGAMRRGLGQRESLVPSKDMLRQMFLTVVSVASAGSCAVDPLGKPREPRKNSEDWGVV